VSSPKILVLGTGGRRRLFRQSFGPKRGRCHASWGHDKISATAYATLDKIRTVCLVTP